MLEDWRNDCVKILDMFLNKARPDGDMLTSAQVKRWGLFTTNISLQRALLFGQTPNVEVARRFDDAPDDAARVGGEMLDRVLNEDLQGGGDGALRAMKYALDDFLLYDFGQVRLRYEVDTEATEAAPAQTDEAGKELAPAVPAAERTSDERLLTEWVHRLDFMWSAGTRVWEERRWLAYGTDQTRGSLVEKFGEQIGKSIPLNAKKGAEAKGGNVEKEDNQPWERARVWEIWNKETREVFFWVKGHPVILGREPDPLKLREFFPSPRPLSQNSTTDSMVPRPDYILAEDHYRKLDGLFERADLLQKALAVRGVYDGKAEGIQRLLKEGASNELIPVDNWAMFAEAGGLKGQIDWLPLEQIVQALGAIREEMAATKADLYEVTGFSDIIRGQGQREDVTAQESRSETRFASVRMQARQDEFARFASDIQGLRAEIICSHFEPERIIQRSNVLNTEDALLAQQAVALLKDKVSREYRIEVRPESMSMADFAAQKAERLEVLAAIGSFMTQAIPLVQAAPQMLPGMLKLLQWTLAGLRGARGAEGVIDPMIQQAEAQLKQAAANPQPQPQDPKLAVVQAKMQADQMKAQSDMQRLQVKAKLDVQTEAQKQQIQTEANIEEEHQRLALKEGLAARADARKAALGQTGTKETL